MQKYELSVTCEVCGNHVGAGFNHDECAKIRQKSHEIKAAKKPASKRKMERLADACRKYGW